MHQIPSKRIATHANTCAAVVAEILAQSLLEGRPADRCLAAIFLRQRHLGARDRRIIGETLFSVLRWWGWLRHLAPPEFISCLENGRTLERALPESYWFACFAAAWYLDLRFELPPSVTWWLYHSGCKMPEFNLPAGTPVAIKDRRRFLKPFLAQQQLSLPLPIEELVPAWSLDKLAPLPRPWSELLEMLQTRPPLWLRAQTNDLDYLLAELNQADIKATAHPRLSHALQAPAGAAGNLRSLPVFRQGLLEVQDIASQAVAWVCDPKPGQKWWDTCAGAGGKTLHLAWLMQGKGNVMATDKRLYKLQDLKLRARKAQYPNITCKEWLGVEVPRYQRLFHGVLVDAPCSCSGTWRRNPDACWNTRPEELPDFVSLQLQLLTNASRAVADQGTLVYATCSYFYDENEGVVKQFLRANQDFALAPFKCPVTGKMTDGQSQIWPWDADCDAMFTAKFKRVR